MKKIKIYFFENDQAYHIFQTADLPKRLPTVEPNASRRQNELCSRKSEKKLPNQYFQLRPIYELLLKHLNVKRLLRLGPGSKNSLHACIHKLMFECLAFKSEDK